MHRSLSLTLVTATFLLVSCSGSEADQVLMHMHEKFMAQIQERARLIEQPLLARTNADLRLKISEVPGSLPASADIALALAVLHDVRDERNPLIDLGLELGILVEAPSGVLGTGSAPGGTDTFRVDAEINARAVERLLLVNIAAMKAEASGLLPAPFVLPEAIQSKWYGATFDELNRMLAESATEEGEKAPTVETLISSMFRGARATPRDIEELWKEIHMWNAVELLPEKNGRVQVRVESDKEKIRSSIRAFVRYLERTSGPSWQNQFQTNPEFQKLLTDLEDDDSEFMKTMGTIKGVIGADKATYEFMSFEGDIENASGALVGKVAFDRGQESDFTLSITDMESDAEPTTVTLTKKGTQVRMTDDGKEVMKGTVSKTKVDLVMTDAGTGGTIATVAFDITEWTETKLVLTNGRFTVPEEKISVTMSELTIDLTNDFKDMTMNLLAAGTLAGKPLFTVDLSAERTETEPFTVEKPSYEPFENLNADFMGAFMGGAAIE